MHIETYATFELTPDTSQVIVKLDLNAIQKKIEIVIEDTAKTPEAIFVRLQKLTLYGIPVRFGNVGDPT